MDDLRLLRVRERWTEAFGVSVISTAVVAQTTIVGPQYGTSHLPIEAPYLVTSGKEEARPKSGAEGARSPQRHVHGDCAPSLLWSRRC